MTELQAILRREIAQHGPISLARFMELALYCPGLGYYEQARPAIGRRGDYFTSVSTGSLFGELLAQQCAEWAEALPAGTWQLVEAGAHDGRMAADMLAWLRLRGPALFARLEYWIIEPSPPRQAWQRARLEEFTQQARWADSLAALPRPVRGVILSNEFLDAFPLYRLGWDAAERRWFEWRIGAQAGDFVWVKQATEPAENAARLKACGVVLPPELLAVLPDGFTVDLSPEAGAWWGEAARALDTGRLLTLDYGLTTAELFRPDRCQGTLRAYHQHRLRPDPLACAGEQDLTAHIHFTQLQRVGEAAGLRTEGLFSQAEFLTRIAAKTWEAGAGGGGWTSKQVRQFQTLTHPDHLGETFRVLVQSRG